MAWLLADHLALRHLWLLPFAALLPLSKSALLLAVIILTTVICPLTFEALSFMRTPAVAMLNLRNVLLVVFYAWVVWPEAVRVPALRPVPVLERGHVRKAANHPGTDAKD